MFFFRLNSNFCTLQMGRAQQRNHSTSRGDDPGLFLSIALLQRVNSGELVG
jgi:hypothetical protein